MLTMLGEGKGIFPDVRLVQLARSHERMMEDEALQVSVYCCKFASSDSTNDGRQRAAMCLHVQKHSAVRDEEG